MQNLSNIILRNIVLWVFPILSYYGYYYIGFNIQQIKLFYFLSVPLIAIFSFSTFASKQKCFIGKGMQIITITLLFSIFWSYVFWGQNVSFGYRATAPTLCIFFFFFLKKCKFTEVEIETYIKINAIIWFLLWFYAFSQAPNIVFGYDPDSELEERGIFRINISGSLSVAICYFMYLNKFVNDKKYSHLIISILCLFGIWLQLSRQLIFFSLIIGFIYLFIKIKKTWIIVAGFIISLFFVQVNISDDTPLGALINLSERQLEDAKYGEGNGYVRVKTNIWLFSEFSNNPIAVLVGNGFPHSNSSYGKHYSRLQDDYGYYLSDAGYAQIYAIIGIIGMYAVLRLFYKSIKNPLGNPNYVWIKLVLIYMILYNIGSGAILSHFIYLSLIFYLYELKVLEFNN